jgi:hypothetical protein
MIKRISRPLLLLFALAAMTLQLSAQVNFLFNASVSGKDMRGLSAVQIINTTRENYTGNIDIEVKGADHNVTVVKIFMSSVNIVPGNNLVPYAKFRGANVYYASTSEGDYVRQTGNMPEGELEFCFKLTITSKDNPAEIYENCFLGTNIIATPLELILPDNGDNFCNKRPRFSWQPPLPLAPGTSFTMKLALKNADQSQAEALLVNTPVIFQSNIKGHILPFPAGSPDLKEGSTYVWQVTAEEKGKQSFSEVWEFAIQCEKQQTTDKSYRELKAEDDGGFLTTGADLRFAVYNSYTPGTLKYSIKDLADPDKKIKGLPAIELQKGANNILLDLRKVQGIEDGKEYLLAVILPDGAKVSMRFKYQEDNE